MEPTHQPLLAHKNIIYLNATFCRLLWGSAYPAIESEYEILQIAIDDIPSKIAFAGYHFLFAELLLLLLAVTQRKPIDRSSPRQYGQLTLLGLTQTSLQYIFFYIGLVLVAGVKGSIMNATGIFFNVLLTHFIYHNDKLSYNKALDHILGFTDVMAVNLSSGADLSFDLLGGGSVVMVAFILSVTTLYGKHISQTVDPTAMTGYRLDGDGLALVIDGYTFGGTPIVYDVSSVAILDYLTLLSSVAFVLWSIPLKHDRVGVTASFNSLIPASGAVLSAVLLDESTLEWKYAVALMLVCSGIQWANKVKHRRFTLMPGDAITYQAWNHGATALNGRG